MATKKILPDRGSLESALNAAAAVVTQKAPERPENEAVKFVNIRLKETEYKQLAKLAIDAGITKAAFCKISALYIAEMVEQGALSIGGGGIIDRRR